jgi:hypothetical protein
MSFNWCFQPSTTFVSGMYLITYRTHTVIFTKWTVCSKSWITSLLQSKVEISLSNVLAFPVEKSAPPLASRDVIAQSAFNLQYFITMLRRLRTPTTKPLRVLHNYLHPTHTLSGPPAHKTYKATTTILSPYFLNGLWFCSPAHYCSLRTSLL